MTGLGKSPLVFQFKWDLNGTTKFENVTILSKMITFRKQKLFRAALKIQPSSKKLIFMTTNLNKMGMKVVAMSYSSPGSSSLYPSDHVEMAAITSKEDKNGSVQLFTASYFSSITANSSFNFHIYITGTVEGYQVQQMDGLLKEQIWSSTVANPYGTDFEITTGEKKFSVHKFILAARSPVFASQFNNEKSSNPVLIDDEEEGSQQRNKDLDGVDSECMEQFLKFIYTGELEEPVINDGLIQLATTYQIKTLENLCQAASADIDDDQMIKVALKLKTETSQSTVIVKSETDSEITFLPNSFVLDCYWKPGKCTEAIGKEKSFESGLFTYGGENLFGAQVKVTEKMIRNPSYNTGSGWKEPEQVPRYTFKFIFYRYPRKKIGCKVDRVTFSTPLHSLENLTTCKKMEETQTTNEKFLQMFVRTRELIDSDSLPFSITFHVQLTNSFANFGHALIDSTWITQLWTSAINKQHTDVEFLVGEESMAAHRFLLSVRSPVFAAMFGSGMKESQTGRVLVDDVEPDIFRHFLQFLYTGILESSTKRDKLYAVADKYQVETLMDLCRPSTQPLDIGEYTKAFLSC